MIKVFLIALLSVHLMADSFTQGTTSLGLKLGSTSTRINNYGVAGLGGNYFVVDNLAIGLGYEYWFFGNPTIQNVTLNSTYYIPMHKKFRPYAGALYRHIFISGQENLDSLGYRAGLAITHKKLLISIGLIQEFYTRDTIIFGDSQIYGELIVGVSF